MCLWRRTQLIQNHSNSSISFRKNQLFWRIDYLKGVEYLIRLNNQLGMNRFLNDGKKMEGQMRYSRLIYIEESVPLKNNLLIHQLKHLLIFVIKYFQQVNFLIFHANQLESLLQCVIIKKNILLNVPEMNCFLNQSSDNVFSFVSPLTFQSSAFFFHREIAIYYVYIYIL